jgi:hypothetical protein
MDKLYTFNYESCSYQELKKPFLMHNLLLIILLSTSLMFFVGACYYHSENQKTLELAPLYARKCFSDIDSLRMEIAIQQNHYQQVFNKYFLIKNGVINTSDNSWYTPMNNKEQ